YFNDVCVGAMVSKKVVSEDSKDTTLLILTIGVLKAYRRLGIASLLLDHLITEGTKKKFKEIQVQVPMDEITALKNLLEKKSFTEGTICSEFYGNTGAQIFSKIL
ncbi:hypothetical protein HK096_006312, partial [Nowakowskiella sp. JEL0078]